MDEWGLPSTCVPTNNVGELQAFCCAVLWLAEQTQLDDSMRMDIRFDSKYAAAAAMVCSGARRTRSWQAQASLALCEWECCWRFCYDPCEESQRRAVERNDWLIG